MAAIVWPCPKCDTGYYEPGEEECCVKCDPWRFFCWMWHQISLYRNGRICRVCHKWWHSKPGTIYCAGHHGTCGICGTPRGGCKCLRTHLD